MTPMLFFVLGFLLTCQAFTFDPPKTPVKFSDIHAGLRKDVDKVAEVLIHSALGVNKVSSNVVTSQLGDVIVVQLRTLVDKLAVESNFTRANVDDKLQFCCKCNRCTRSCRVCGKTCCCNGSGGCHCKSCLSQSALTFEAITTPLNTFDDVAKNWAIESKEQLRKTVKTFFTTILSLQGYILEAPSVNLLQNKPTKAEDYGISMVDSLIDKILLNLN